MNAQHSSGEPDSVFTAMGRQIALTPIPDPHPATLRRRLAGHPRLTAGVGALIAAAAVTVVFFTTGAVTTAPPAFAVAVSRNSVTITLRQAAALKSLNARLAAENLPVRVVPVVPGCTATARVVGPNGGTVTRTVKPEHVVSHLFTLTIRWAPDVPAGGNNIVVGVADGHTLLTPVEVKGPVPSCVR